MALEVLVAVVDAIVVGVVSAVAVVVIVVGVVLTCSADVRAELSTRESTHRM